MIVGLCFDWCPGALAPLSAFALCLAMRSLSSRLRSMGAVLSLVRRCPGRECARACLTVAILISVHAVGRFVLCALLLWLWPHAVLVDVVADRLRANPLLRILVRFRLVVAVLWASISAAMLLWPWQGADSFGILRLSVVDLCRSAFAYTLQAVSHAVALTAKSALAWSSSAVFVYYSLVLVCAVLTSRPRPV